MTDAPLIALVGAGPMAQAYALALVAQGHTPRVIGRGEASAARFTEVTGIEVLTGGLEANSDALAGITHAIIAVPVQSLAAQTRAVIQTGVGQLLIEKPGGLNGAEIKALTAFAKNAGAQVSIAYNRRFYAAVREAKCRIAKDGGVSSLRFEVSEWSHRIAPSGQADTVKAAWFLANSSHVVDMAFFLGGFPTELHTAVEGTLEWHTPARFVGHGRTDTGALFSYHGDWGAAPRWMVEVCTRAGHTYMFNPLEQLKRRTIEGFEIEDVDLPDAVLDTKYKPGVYRQLEAFLQGNLTDFVNLKEQCDHVDHIYAPMAGLD